MATRQGCCQSLCAELGIDMNNIEIFAEQKKYLLLVGD
jgi:hypothetical protein